MQKVHDCSLAPRCSIVCRFTCIDMLHLMYMCPQAWCVQNKVRPEVRTMLDVPKLARFYDEYCSGKWVSRQAGWLEQHCLMSSWAASIGRTSLTVNSSMMCSVSAAQLMLPRNNGLTCTPSAHVNYLASVFVQPKVVLQPVTATFL